MRPALILFMLVPLACDESPARIVPDSSRLDSLLDGGRLDRGGSEVLADRSGEGPRGDVAPGACTLQSSGPVTATSDGQIIERLRITSTNGPAVKVSGRKNVVLRNLEIRHAGGPGIAFSGADGILIEDCVIIHTGAPAQGKSPSDGLNNIDGYDSLAVTIRRVRLVRGSSGIYLHLTPGATLSYIEGHDFRGPSPRGQLVQLNRCDSSLLEDFSCLNPQASSWPEDNVSVFQSSSCTVRRGLLDGNNSPSGVGVMFEQSGGQGSGGLCEDVDAVRMGNGCFSGYPAKGVSFRRTRCRDNICTDQGRGAPLSGGLGWAGSPDSTGLSIEDSSYFNLCAGLVWSEPVFLKKELAKKNFALRAPLSLSFCWSPPP